MAKLTQKSTLFYQDIDITNSFVKLQDLTRKRRSLQFCCFKTTKKTQTPIMARLRALLSLC